METLVFKDTQNLHQGIQKLYALHNLDTFGVDALSILNQLVPSEIPSFHFTHLREHQISSTFLPNCSGYTPAMEKVIHQHFGEHPLVRHMSQILNGAYKISDFISQQKLHRFEGLYQQFLRLLDVEDQMVFFLPNANSESWCNLSQADETLVGFSLNRTQRNFTERDRLILNLLRPHLFQAYCNVQHYQQLQQELSQLQQSLNHLGLVILDAQGQMQSIAPQATVWLETYFTKSTCTLKLPDHLWSWVQYQVASFTSKPDLSKTCLPLRIQQAGRELVIRLIVEQPEQRYLLLLEEQTLSSLYSLVLLGLSQRETEVLSWVMQGKENKAIATQLSINVSTVRKHLESIYNKFGVHSRTEAIAQALAKLGIPDSLPLACELNISSTSRRTEQRNRILI
jgi:DNA-binding CsgD family transcriptional regulator